jgi:hypothetical protein
MYNAVLVINLGTFILTNPTRWMDLFEIITTNLFATNSFVKGY